MTECVYYYSRNGLIGSRLSTTPYELSVVRDLRLQRPDSSGLLYYLRKINIHSTPHIRATSSPMGRDRVYIS